MSKGFKKIMKKKLFFLLTIVTFGLLAKPFNKVIEIITEPAGAEVLINNLSYGFTPINTNITKQKFKLTLTKKGYSTIVDTIFLTSSDTSFVYSMFKKQGHIIFDIMPENCKIIINKTKVNAKKVRLKTGQHIIKVKALGFFTYEDTINLKSNQTIIIKKELTPKPKQLQYEMVKIDKGTFIMGSNIGIADEKPEHKVILSSFYAGKYEVSKMLWEYIMGDAVIDNETSADSISWLEAVEFCNKFSVLSGLQPCYVIEGGKVFWNKSKNGYRLPTEAEWEYFARTDKNYKYSGSNNLSKVAWYKKNSKNKIKKSGLRQSNSFGLHDVSGNVYEWCFDDYNSSFYNKKSTVNPVNFTNSNVKVFRGGAIDSYEAGCLVSFRNYLNKNVKLKNHGLRLVKSTTKKQNKQK